jgi:hypothetical protein
MPVSVKRKSAKDVLVERIAQMIDKKYDEMSDEEISASQKKLKAQRDRVRASHARKRETA